MPAGEEGTGASGKWEDKEVLGDGVTEMGDCEMLKGLVSCLLGFTERNPKDPGLVK